MATKLIEILFNKVYISFQFQSDPESMWMLTVRTYAVVRVIIAEYSCTCRQ